MYLQAIEERIRRLLNDLEPETTLGSSYSNNPRGEKIEVYVESSHINEVDLEGILGEIMEMVEDVYDRGSDSGYGEGYDDGYNKGREDSKDEFLGQQR